MHESALVRDLMERAKQEAGDRRITLLRFRIGALSAVSPEVIADGARHYAEQQWGYEPEVIATRSSDYNHAGALGVRLVSVGVDD